MPKAYRERHTYISDTEREIAIEIFYAFELPDAPVDERLRLGGFSRDEISGTEILGCDRVYIPRRRFKPRHVLLSFANNCLLKVVCRTHQRWVELVNDDDRVMYAYGEGGCPIKAD
ncbi:MAG: hypothetical protein KME17_08180 [Cyanosarcina radialis HA8281-LM2]|jgi:hypothetical protein|nr:hypothetical protein [Cyanosarcina radialis HA8281-LM2]